MGTGSSKRSRRKRIQITYTRPLKAPEQAILRKTLRELKEWHRRFSSWVPPLDYIFPHPKEVIETYEKRFKHFIDIIQQVLKENKFSSIMADVLSEIEEFLNSISVLQRKVKQVRVTELLYNSDFRRADRNRKRQWLIDENVYDTLYDETLVWDLWGIGQTEIDALKSAIIEEIN